MYMKFLVDDKEFTTWQDARKYACDQYGTKWAYYNDYLQSIHIKVNKGDNDHVYDTIFRTNINLDYMHDENKFLCEKISVLEGEIAILNKRVEGLRDAVKRWQSRAGGQKKDGENEIVRVEYEIANRPSSSRLKWVNKSCYDSYGRKVVHILLRTAPVDPKLEVEAYNCLKEEQKKQTMRMYFDKRGWVVVLDLGVQSLKSEINIDQEKEIEKVHNLVESSR